MKSWHVKGVPLVRPLKIPILVQHAVREELDLMSVPQSISHLSQDPTVVFLTYRTLMNLFSLQGNCCFSWNRWLEVQFNACHQTFESR